MVAHASRNGCRMISQLILRWEKRSNFASATPTVLLFDPSSFSMSVMIWAKAKMPISTGRNGKPPPMNSEPKVKRGTLAIGSVPMTVMRSPMAVESSPLTSEASVSPATIAIASTNSEKYSHGPNSSAMAASGPVRKTRHSAPSSPPHTEAHTPSQIARPGSPLRAIGKAVEGGGDRRRRARNAEQTAGDEAAGRAADVDARHRRQPGQRIEPVGKGQDDDHRHGDRHARQRAADDAHQRAQEQGHACISTAGW